MAVRNNSDALNELVNGVNGAEGLQSKINKKAPLNSPALTGTPTAPTPAKNVSGSNRLATTAYVLSLLKNDPTIIDDVLTALDDKLDSSQYTTEKISELAFSSINKTDIFDLNDLRDPGFYRLSEGESPTGSIANFPPRIVDKLYILVFKIAGWTNRLQLAWDVDGTMMFMRGGVNGTWRAWKELT